MKVILKTKSFSLTGKTITEVVLKWIAVKQSFDQFEEIEILSIEEIQLDATTIPEKDQSNDQSQA